jgi:hypothetical protein
MMLVFNELHILYKLEDVIQQIQHYKFRKKKFYIGVCIFTIIIGRQCLQTIFDFTLDIATYSN